MKIALSENAKKKINFEIQREKVDIKNADFTEICAAIITKDDIKEIERVDETKFHIPKILVTEKYEICSSEIVKMVDKIIDIDEGNIDIHTKQVETLHLNMKMIVYPHFLD